MAPAGSYESLHAAIDAGANSVYFGVGRLNMRAQSAANFTLEDMGQIVSIARERPCLRGGRGRHHRHRYGRHPICPQRRHGRTYLHAKQHLQHRSRPVLRPMGGRSGPGPGTRPGAGRPYQPGNRTAADHGPRRRAGTDRNVRPRRPLHGHATCRSTPATDSRPTGEPAGRSAVANIWLRTPKRAKHSTSRATISSRPKTSARSTFSTTSSNRACGSSRSKGVRGVRNTSNAWSNVTTGRSGPWKTATTRRNWPPH